MIGIWSRCYGVVKKIKFTLPVSFGCISPVLSVAYAHTLRSGRGKNNSKQFRNCCLNFLTTPMGVKDLVFLCVHLDKRDVILYNVILTIWGLWEFQIVI